MKKTLQTLALIGIIACNFWQPLTKEVFGSTNLTTLKSDLQFGINEYANIPDSNLRKALNEKYLHQSKDAQITVQQLRRLKGTLYLGASNISDLTGLEHCKGITGLYLGYNSISDISPLKNLKNLRTLNLINQNIQAEDVITKDNTAYVNNVIKGIKSENLAPTKSRDYSYDASRNVIRFNNINSTGEKSYNFKSKISYGDNNRTTYFSGKVTQNIIKEN